MFFFCLFFLVSGQIDTDIDVELDDCEKNVVIICPWFNPYSDSSYNLDLEDA